MRRERKANRLRGYDYGKENIYFITICVLNRLHYFGKIDEEGEMTHNKYGDIAYNQWQWLIHHFPYLYSHAFVVMPNHIHGVIEINYNLVTSDSDLSVDINAVRTSRDLSLHNRFETIKMKSLSELIGAYKTTCSKHIHLAGGDDFKWQRSFHDHIIRNEKSFANIVSYVKENPLRWNTDKYNNV